MSVVRGRPPGLAGGMNGSSSRYWSSLSAWPDPKSPTSTRSSRVHIEASQPESPPERRHHNRPALVKPTSTPFQNRLLFLRVVVVLILGLQAAAFCSVSHFAKDIHREEAQPSFLVVVQARIERLPRIGELFQVGCSCRQGIGAITQKLDRIELTLATGPCDQVYQALAPGHCSDTDRLLHSRPVFRLVRGQLQSEPDKLDAPIRQRLEHGITEALL